jgi:hypothetical protein
MVLSIRETESHSAAHANIGIDPFGGRTTVEHAAGDFAFWWKAESFIL